MAVTSPAAPMTGVRLRARRLHVAAFLLAGLVTAAVLLPPAYLLFRASEGGGTILTTLTRPSAVAAMWRTVLLTTTVTGACIAVAVPLAWLVMRTDLPFARVWIALLTLPLAVPSFVGGFVMISALGPGGLVQDLLEPFGVQRLPSIYGFSGAWLVLTTLSYPYVFLQVCAALRRENPALEEAARGLGKGAWTTFLRVNLPQLRPAISAGGILVALYVLSEFGAVSMLRYDTLTPLVYIQYTTQFDRTGAAVLGLPLILMAIALLAADGLTRNRSRYHAQGQRRVPKQLRLGGWRWPAIAVCLVPLVLGVVVPVGVLVYWLAAGLLQGARVALPFEVFVNTAQVAGASAVVAVLASMPLAWVSVRHRGWLSTLMERASYSGQALPAITIALSLVFFATRFAGPLYQTLGLLVFAYTVRFLPEALGATRTALLQVNPNGEEAARSLGAGTARTLAQVTAPQMLPGVSAGALLVFLTVMKELPITLLLSPTGYTTFATLIWSTASEAFFARAALPSLVLLVLSGVAVLVMLRREESA